MIRSGLRPEFSGGPQVLFFDLSQSLIVHFHHHKKNQCRQTRVQMTRDGVNALNQIKELPTERGCCCLCFWTIKLEWHYFPQDEWIFLFNFALLRLTFPIGLQNLFLLRVNIIASKDAALQGHNCRAVKMTLLPLAVGQPSIVMSPPAVPASTNGSKSLLLPYSAWKLTLCPELMQGQMQNPVYSGPNIWFYKINATKQQKFALPLSHAYTYKRCKK